MEPMPVAGRTETRLKLPGDRADSSGMKNILDSLVLDNETWIAALMDLLDAIELEWALQTELGIDPPAIADDSKPFEVL